MVTVIITLNSTALQGSLDLEIPADVQVQQLLPELTRALHLPNKDNAGRRIIYRLIRQKRHRPVHPSESLQNAGVRTGEVLSLESSVAGHHQQTGGRNNTSALLRAPSGVSFSLDNYGKQELTLGRYDARTGESPDIDLSREPEGSTVSRPHAMLRKQGLQWMLIPVSNKNPTAVDGNQIPHRQPCPLRSGNIITLGNVELIFERG
jgi:hypothetical protein